MNHRRGAQVPTSFARAIRVALAAAACLLSVITAVERPAEAAVTRIESESLAPAGGCWGLLSFGGLSGGAGRSCHQAGAQLSWTMTATGGDIVRLYGYRDSVRRGFRVRVDDGAWTEGVLSGSTDYSALFFTSAALPSGSHVFTLEPAPSDGAFTFDFYETEGGAGISPTTNAPSSSAGGPGLTGRTEAEALAHTGPCWSPFSFSSLSGGAGRTCYSAGEPLAWTVGAGHGDVLRLYGYRDSATRGFRVRVDDGPWTEGVLSGATEPSALFFTSASLSSGNHTVALEWAPSAGGFTVDYLEVTGSAGAAPVVTTPPTTIAPTGPPPTGSGVCAIAPPDSHTAIAGAIASCPDGSTVQFPVGAVYHQTDPIDVADRRNLVIDGGGSRFLSSVPNVDVVKPNWQIRRGTNVTIRNMTVEGNFKLAGPRSLLTVSGMAVNQRNSGFFILGGDGVTIADVEVKDVFGDLVTVVPSNWPSGLGAADGGEVARNVRLQRIDGTRAARQCITVTSASGFWLEDSTLRDCWYGGVDLERDEPGETQRDVHILRNTFDGFNLFAIALPLPGNDGATNGVEIRGNKIVTPGDTCFAPIMAGYLLSGPARFWNVVIEDNEVKTLHNGIVLDRVQDGSVRRNRIERTVPASLCGPPAGVPVVLTNSAVVVSENTVVGFG